ncbi:hypothetical protein AAG596_06145 [Citromicrobium bathyomarinum]|uniref:hypothetical protein n=1 Tax=Citromicrobium bathyomarinum TaxID=72174 RepID=UPI00315B3CAC
MENSLTPHEIALLNDRQLQIGNICHQWAAIEYHIALCIWSLLGIDYETGVILTGGLTMRPRVNMAVKLAVHLNAPKEAIDALTEIRKTLDGGLEDARNSAVHAVRFKDASNPASELVEMHRGRKKGRHPRTNAELRQLGTDIHAAGKTLKRRLDGAGIYNLPMRKPTAAMALKTSRTRSPPDSQPGS